MKNTAYLNYYKKKHLMTLFDKAMAYMRLTLRSIIIIAVMIICFLTTLSHMLLSNFVKKTLILVNFFISSLIFKKNSSNKKNLKHKLNFIIHKQQAFIINFFCRIFVKCSFIELTIYKFIDKNFKKSNKTNDISNLLKISSTQKLRAFYDTVYKKSLKHNTSNDKNLAPLILSNHISFSDILIIGSLIPTTFVAKNDVKKWPLIGHFVRWSGVIFLKRKSMIARYKSLFQIKKRLNYTSVCIFPEATTTASLMARYDLWQSGNIWTVVYKQDKEIINNNNKVITLSVCYKNTKENAWTGNTSFIDLIFSMLKRKKTEVILVWSCMETTNSEECNLRELSMKIYTRIATQCLLGNKKFK